MQSSIHVTGNSVAVVGVVDFCVVIVVVGVVLAVVFDGTNSLEVALVVVVLVAVCVGSHVDDVLSQYFFYIKVNSSNKV